MGTISSGLAKAWSSIGGFAAAVAVLAILGAAFANFGFFAKLVVAAVLLAALLSLPLRALLGAVVVATFATRISLSVGTIDIRPEHFVTCALVARLLYKHGLRLTRRQTQVLAALTAFLVLNIVSTALQAPDPGRSVSILGWIALDIALFAALADIRPYRDQMIRIGVVTSMFAAALAVVVEALATFAGTTIGVQLDPPFGHAAYVLSYEANTLASSIAIWAVVAALVRWPRRGIQYALQLLAIAGIVATHTRAALIGYVGAMALIAVWRRWLPIPVLATIGVVAASLVFVVPLVTPSAPSTLQPVVSKFSHALDFKSGNGLLRVRSWKFAAADMKGSAYFLGLGTNSYGQRHLFTTAPGTTIPGYLGNLPLQIMYDVGILGVVLLAFVVAVVARATSSITWIALGFVYLTCSIATSIFWFSLTWILIALALSRDDSSTDASLRAPCTTTQAA